MYVVTIISGSSTLPTVLVWENQNTANLLIKSSLTATQQIPVNDLDYSETMIVSEWVICGVKVARYNETTMYINYKKTWSYVFIFYVVVLFELYKCRLP